MIIVNMQGNAICEVRLCPPAGGFANCGLRSATVSACWRICELRIAKCDCVRLLADVRIADWYLRIAISMITLQSWRSHSTMNL